MRTYYRTDLTRLNHREMWRIGNGVIGYTLLFLQKYLRFPAVKHAAVPADDELHLVDERDLPRQARPFFTQAIQECEALDMSLAFCATVHSLRNRSAYAAYFLSDDGQSWGSALWVRVHVMASPRIESGMVFSTKFSDGTFFSTTNIRPRFDSPPEYHVVRMPGADAAALEACHYEALREMRDKETISLDVETLKQISVEVRKRVADYLIRRGIWIPLTESEIASLEVEE